MPPLALALVLIAACLHTTWNVLLKRSAYRQFSGWWAMLVGAILFSPLIVAAWPLPPEIWPYVLASAVVEAAYMLLLSAAYGHGDFSLVYPIARGTAPALLAIWAHLFLGDRLSTGGMLGLGIVLGGLMVIGAGHWWAQRGQQKVHLSGIGLALGVALAISVYSAIDAAAVRIANPSAYNAIIFGATWLAQAPAVFGRYGMKPAFHALRADWKRIIPIGVLMLLTYMFVLMAYASTTASYVGAVREVSIVIAAFVGWRWLNEGMGKLRLLGSCITFGGVLLIALLA